MSINIQCVYGDKDIAHINNVILPNIKIATKEYVNFYSLNYQQDSEQHIALLERDNFKVYDIKSENRDRRSGFGENHNTIFKKCVRSDNFILLNPDCILVPECVDALIESKTSHPDAAIVEGRQWPYEHPKKYNKETQETNWASGCFSLIDSNFFETVNGFDPVFFLYNEDVDLSWRAWLNGYTVIYEPKAQIMHFSDSFCDKNRKISNECYGCRNNIILSRKYFGKKGEERMIKLLKDRYKEEFCNILTDDYYRNIEQFIDQSYLGRHNSHVVISGIDIFD